MQNRSFPKKAIFTGCLIALAALTLITVAFTGAAQAKTVQLKAVSFMNTSAVKSKLFIQMIDAINHDGAGKFQIKLLGGPEVIGNNEQAQSVARGVVDMAMIPPALIQGMVPESVVMLLSRISQAEEDARGIMDKLQPYYNKAGLYCLGEIFATNDPQFIIYTSKKITALDQLKGETIGGSGPLVIPVTEALGFGFKSVPFSEAYTALERKMVNGWYAPTSTIYSFAGQEQLKYGLDHPVFADNMVVIVNLKKWNSLPEDTRAVIKASFAKTAPELGILNYEEELKARKAFEAAGIEYTKLSDAEAAQFIDTAYNSMWDKWETRMPAAVKEFKPLLSE